ncbi:MAG TPA: hypothetical protein VJA18_05745 [Candidatus Nanoarchaeia archaeon]|nr:hypothetical protein [Candidatus Nanoarchaeia archaeon]
MNLQPDFWTNGIILGEEISRLEYSAMKRLWGDQAMTDKIDTYVRMSNPVIARTYQELVARFLQHPQGKEIMLMEQGFGRHWFRPEKISPRLTNFIAGLAADHEHLQGYFEMHFRPMHHYEGIEERARISFRKYGDLLVGNEISVHRDNLDFFTSNIDYPNQILVSAICHPDAVQIRS